MDLLEVGLAVGSRIDANDGHVISDLDAWPGPPSRSSASQISETPRSSRPVDGLDEGIGGRDDPIVLVHEAVSARDRLAVLLDERIVGGDDSLVMLTECQELTRKAGLRTDGRRSSRLAHLRLHRVELVLRIVAPPLQRLEGLIEALQLEGDGRESLLIDVDLGLERPTIVLALCVVLHVKSILSLLDIRLFAHPEASDLLVELGARTGLRQERFHAALHLPGATQIDVDVALLVRGNARGESLPVGLDIEGKIAQPLVLRQGDHDGERDRHRALLAQARANLGALPVHVPARRGLAERAASHVVEQAILVYVIEDRGRG